MISVQHQLVGVPLSHNVTLECFVESYPTAMNYWSTENEQMIHDNLKYK